MIHTHNQIVTKHSGESSGLMIWRLWVQTPLGAIFDEIYFVLCNLRSVRKSNRNASDWPIVKNLIIGFLNTHFCQITWQI